METLGRGRPWRWNFLPHRSNQRRRNWLLIPLFAPTYRRAGTPGGSRQGRLLYDLPRGRRPGGDVAAPVRFLPRYDELLISYQHRGRVIAPAHRRAVYTKNAIVEAVVMVDGFAAGTWTLVRAKDEAVLRVSPFARLAPKDRAAVEAEGHDLLAFLAPDVKNIGVRFA